MKIDIRASSLSFVYPFAFDPVTFDDRSEAASALAWPRGDTPLPVWRRADFQVDELLHHVGPYLQEGDPTLPPTARLWEVPDDTLQAINGGLGFHTNVEWTLVCPAGRGEPPQSLRFDFDEVRLVLFRSGVGFLHFRVTLHSPEVDHWLDFCHYFRFVNGGRSTGLVARRRSGFDAAARQPTFERFFPGPAGGPPAPDAPPNTLAQIVRPLLDPGDARPWWNEVFMPGQMLPFVSYFIDEVEDHERAALLYRIRHFAHQRQHLSPAETQSDLSHRSLLPYAVDMWLLCEMNGGGFVALNAPLDDLYFRETLPVRLRQRYFLLFLLVLNQRITLTQMSELVARFGLPGVGTTEQREAAFGQLREGLLAYTARSHFVQVTQQPRQHAAYERWQEAFLVAPLYREVFDEVTDMHRHYSLESTRHVEKLAQRLSHAGVYAAGLGLVLAVPALLLTLVQANSSTQTIRLRDLLQEPIGWGFLVVGLVLGFGVGWLTGLFRRGPPRP